MPIKSWIKKTVITLLLIVLGSINFLVLPTNKANAASSIMGSTSSGCQTSGDCSLKDFMKLIIGSYDMVFGYIGAIALLMFIIGGLMFLISAGNQEKIAQAKKIMISAVIGLAIVFASYLIIDFILDTIGYVNNDTWNATYQ